jgi:hypothetical protein
LITDRSDKRTSSTLSVETETLCAEVQEFLASLRDLGEDYQMRVLDVNLADQAVAAGQSVAGRVLKISTGLALFDGPLQTAPGTLIELEVAALDRPQRGRFVERIAAGCQIQLLLNQRHLNYMECAMNRLAAAA